MGTGAPARLERKLHGCRDMDALAVMTLRALLVTSGVVRAGLALTVLGGRQLRFLSSDSDRMRPPPDWCLVDALDPLPLNEAVRTGRQIVCDTAESIRRSYADLPTSQAGRTIRSLAAVPLNVGDERLGGLLVYSTRERDAGLVPAVSEVARVVSHRLDEIRRAGQTWVRPDPQDGMLLPADATAPSLARETLHETLKQLGVEGDTLHAAMVCASELVTNVVMHTGRPSLMSVEHTDDALTVRIEQPVGSGRIAAAPDRDPMRISGRGLQLVEALASAWGSETGAASTSTWYRLDL
jgi:anti-sigma regulatory factor (Ser/Thr protein kinase)